ncbi:S-layer homology domain-containing protein [Paenibacillus sp. YIM B09110]|uniref:S-layer homology domain-containing protein n=1 Tax=Paenibacillus sp. YIM B09110 TaxID=3126102 RepID=UPI00301B9955
MRKKWYKVPLLRMLLAFIFAGNVLHYSGGTGAAAEEVVITKTYELREDAAYISFALVGDTGSFASIMTMPNGKAIGSAKSTKKTDATGKASWFNVYAVKSAPKGKYVFTIQAPKMSYYNLVIDLPLFSDTSNHWARAAIETFVEKGIVSGYGNGLFGPNDPVTGEAILKMLVLSLTEEMPNGQRQWLKSFRWRVTDQDLSTELGISQYKFISVGSEHWAKPYIAAANDLGIVASWKDIDFAGSFKRKDVALLVANVMRMVKKEDKLSSFTDIQRLSVDYQKAIGLVSNYSIFNGYPDRSFKPENQVTRAEAVSILSRLVDFLNE